MIYSNTHLRTRETLPLNGYFSRLWIRIRSDPKLFAGSGSVGNY